jgi:hypothetical protein
LRPLNDVVFYSLALLGHCNNLREAPSCIMGRRHREFRDASSQHFAPEEMVLLGLILLNPILLNIVLSWRHGAFWDRYVITTTAMIYIGIAILLGLRLARNRYAGYAAAAVLLVFCVRTGVARSIATVVVFRSM